MSSDKDISPFNNKGEPHGYWEVYRTNGELWFKCNFHNGKLINYYEEWYGYSSNKLNKKRYYL